MMRWKSCWKKYRKNICIDQSCTFLYTFLVSTIATITTTTTLTQLHRTYVHSIVNSILVMDFFFFTVSLHAILLAHSKAIILLSTTYFLLFFKYKFSSSNTLVFFFSKWNFVSQTEYHTTHTHTNPQMTTIQSNGNNRYIHICFQRVSFFFTIGKERVFFKKKKNIVSEMK